MKRGKMHARVRFIGVDIHDRDGDFLTGITHTEAIQLYKSLQKHLPKIRKWARREAML